MSRGPFLFHLPLREGLAAAKQNGFSHVEVFLDDPAAISAEDFKALLDEFELRLTTLGSGAGCVVHGLTLTHKDAGVRRRAVDYLTQTIQLAGKLSARVIVGSMQGRAGAKVEDSLGLLASGLRDASKVAAEYKTHLLYEPLNHYETNLINTIAEGVELIELYQLTNVKLLADLFHMNIEETSFHDAFETGRGHIGHIHLADSNRGPIGTGHTNLAEISHALNSFEYFGTYAVECFPKPDSASASRTSLESFAKHFVKTR
jgi:sugar phosphate isomerase/epimerase